MAAGNPLNDDPQGSDSTLQSRCARRAVKRVLDIVCVLISMPVVLPLTVLVSLFIKLTSEGPVFFTHTRLGRGGKLFEMWKFRTMLDDSHALLLAHFEDYPKARHEWEKGRKLRYDPRITVVGRFLRRTSLDEVPQLWNVLKGDMSLVGPRPIIKDELGKYGDGYSSYQLVRPGLTGMWQVSGRNSISFEKRVELDVGYVREWGLWLDLRILLKTIWTVVTGKGAY